MKALQDKRQRACSNWNMPFLKIFAGKLSLHEISFCSPLNGSLQSLKGGEAVAVPDDIVLTSLFKEAANFNFMLLRSNKSEDLFSLENYLSGLAILFNQNFLLDRSPQSHFYHATCHNKISLFKISQ